MYGGIADAVRGRTRAISDGGGTKRARQGTETRTEAAGTIHAQRACRGHLFFAPPLDVRPGWTEARFCFLTNFACRSSSGNRPVFDDGSVRERVTVTTEFDREGGASTTGDRFPVASIGDFSENIHRCGGEWPYACIRNHNSPPGWSAVVLRRPIFLGTTSRLISFHPFVSSSELARMSATGSAMGTVTALSDGFVVGGGGMSSMNQSWCLIKNSSTSWLR